MKLLMTADAVGGVWTYALDLTRGLRAHGVETVLAVNGPPPSEPPHDLPMIATGLPLDWLAEDPEQVEHAGRTLAELAGDVSADLVQLNSPAYAAGGSFPVPVLGVQHSCTATWWRAVKGAAAWPADFDWRFDLARRGLLACDRVVAPSAAFAAAVGGVYAIDLPQVVWNGRSQAVCFGPLAQPEQSATCVFTAGRLWDEGKGARILDEAATLVAAPIHAAGPIRSPQGDVFAADHLDLLGTIPQAELAAWLARRPVFVSPSLYEPFGLAVLEAAQARCALVLSDIPTFRELWEGAAVFSPPGDPVGLAQALGALIDHPSQRAALGDAAESRSRLYTVAGMASGMVGVFRDLVSAR